MIGAVGSAAGGPAAGAPPSGAYAPPAPGAAPHAPGGSPAPAAVPPLADDAWLWANEPCRAACPVKTDAGAYVTAIAAGDFETAYRHARQHNPFPSICGRVCAAPCEPACRRGQLDAPIAIRALKRTATERFGIESAFGDARWHAAHGPVPPATRASVGVVGAGPAGLAAAYELRLAGHPVTLYDAAGRLGGMMALTIPDFRLPRAVLDGEIDAVVSLGIDVRLGTRVGHDVAVERLLDEHAALFLATGCGEGRALDVPGRDLAGVHKALDFLLAASEDAAPPVGARVVVVGGGSVAFDAARTAWRHAGADEERAAAHAMYASLDAARTARRLGAREVSIVALESRDELRVEPDELRATAGEAIRLRLRRSVRVIEGADGRVAGVRLVPVQRVYDETGRFAPVILDGPEEALACDAVIFAIGQRADASWLPASLGLGAAPWGGVPTDRVTLRTAHPRIWCGGDLAFGPRNLIDAIADGQRAARDIVDAIARGERSAADRSPAVFRPPPVRQHTPPRQHRWSSGYDRIARAPLPVLPGGARTAVAEVEGVLDEAAAIREGARCLRCFENLELDAARCVLCGLCVDVCPTACLSIAAAGTGDDGAPASALVLDETACLRCGLCVDRCPADALELVHAQEILGVSHGAPAAGGTA